MQNNKVQISIKNVPAQLRAEALAKAKREDRSLNQVLRELLRKYVQDQQPAK